MLFEIELKKFISKLLKIVLTNGAISLNNKNAFCFAGIHFFLDPWNVFDIAVVTIATVALSGAGIKVYSDPETLTSVYSRFIEFHSICPCWPETLVSFDYRSIVFNFVCRPCWAVGMIF